MRVVWRAHVEGMMTRKTKKPVKVTLKSFRCVLHGKTISTYRCCILAREGKK